MKRAHLEALTRALGGQARLVASLHVLSQPSLDADDHAFLVAAAPTLHSIDLLRWLARCPAEGPRARIVACLAEEARRDPPRFEAEILGARLDCMTDDDWAELHDRLGPSAPRSLARLVLARTSGSSAYRALLSSPQGASPGDLCLLPHAVDLFAPFASSRPAPRPDALLDLAWRLYPVRNDERACREALLRALPGAIRFSCEHGAPGEAAERDAALRWVAAHLLGEEGLDWLTRQVEEALARGAPLRSLLAELCPSALRAIWPRASGLRGRVLQEDVQALRGLLPAEITEQQILAGIAADSPKGQREAVVALAEETQDGGVCADLLGWLERHDTPRRQLMEVAGRALRRGVLGNDLLAWVASRLATRSSWEQHGVGILSVLLERGACSELAELFAQSWSAAGEGDRRAPEGGEAAGLPGQETPAGFREAVHGALALALLRQTRAAVAAGQEDAALRALSALACLDPPSRLNPALHELARDDTASSAVRELIEINAGLVKHGNGREATLQGVIAAVHVLSSR
jgi:hypothetical protein